MKNLIQYTCLLSWLIIVTAGCQNEKIYTEEYLEVYQIDSTSSEKAQGNLSFKESYVYNPEGIEMAHGIYNPDGSIEGIESYVFGDKSKYPIGSEYKDGEKLLSYYKFIYDGKGKRIKLEAYDGLSKELLRKEEFGYDEDGNRNIRVIKTAADSIVKIYEFTHDKIGNETSVTIKNGFSQKLLTEEFTNKATNEEGKWTEQWGFVNNKAFSYRKRYWKKTKK